LSRTHADITGEAASAKILHPSASVPLKQRDVEFLRIYKRGFDVVLRVQSAHFGAQISGKLSQVAAGVTRVCDSRNFF
jgi:hypothetical protein